MKKALSLVLAVVMVFGMATVAFAAAPKITDIAGGFDYDYSGPGTQGIDSLNLGEIGPDLEVKLYMDVTDFEWEDPTNVPTALSSSHLSNAKITVKKKVTKGSSVLDVVELKKDSPRMYIKVKFVEEYVSTSDQDFDFTVYLAKKSSKIDNTEIQIYGTMKNTEILVDDNDEEVDLSDSAYAKADGYIKNIKIDTGNDLYVNAKMFDGKKYYAKSSVEVTAADDAVMNAYPEIQVIYTLNSINLNSSGNTVTFAISDKYYVYSADGKYLGTTADKLAFSSKYYLANAQIDMSGAEVAETEEPTDDSEPEVIDNPVMGGD